MVLKPKLAPDVPGSRFNTHLMGDRADALMRLAAHAHCDFLALLEECQPVSVTELGERLTEAFAEDVRVALPDAPPLAAVFSRVARYVRSTSWYGNTRVLLAFSWHRDLGFCVASNSSLAHGKEIAPLWGERVKVPRAFALAMKKLKNCSGRSLVENGTQFEVLCGPLAFVNCACREHSNIRAHGVFGLNTCGALTTLVVEDFTGAIPHLRRLPPGEELTFFYAEDYASKLPCTGCAPAISAASWRRHTAEQKASDASALRLSNKEARARVALLRASAAAAPPCNPPGSAHLYPAHDTSSERMAPLPSGHALALERADKLGTFNFVAATLNVNARMAGPCLNKVLGEVLYQMKRHGIAVIALQETGRCTGDGLALDSSGMSERLLVDPSAKQTRYRSLWTLPPSLDASPQGSGLAILWDAALPADSPCRGKSGRISAITLMGPTGVGIRVINVYGKSGPAPPASCDTRDAKYERVIRKLLLTELTEQLEYARVRGWTPLVLGDFNELADAQLDKRPHSTAEARAKELRAPPRPTPLIDLLRGHGLTDTFRAKHPLVRAYTYIGRGKMKARPSRLDYIWCGNRLVKSGRFRAGIDGTQSVFGLSDHLLCHASFTFFSAFHASRERVMSARDELVRTSYPYFLLEEDSTRLQFREALLSRLTPTLATVEALDEGNLSPGDVNTCLLAWAEIERAVVEEGTSLLSAHAAQRAAQGLSPFTLLQRVLSACHRIVNSVRGAISSPDDAPLKGSWRVVTTSWDKLKLLVSDLPAPLPPLVPTPLRDSAWRKHTFRTVGTLAQRISKQWTAEVHASIRACITVRNDAYEAAVQLNKPAHMLARAMHDGSAVLPIRQAVTPEGGLTTCPATVREAVGKIFYEHTRSRKREDARVAPMPLRPPGPDITLPGRRSKDDWAACFLATPRGKAAGPSGLVPEMLRALPPSMASTMGWMIDTFMLAGVHPPSFLHGNIFPIPKKGALSALDARPIALLELPLKMLTYRVQIHVRAALEKFGRLSASQFGFRKGKGCPQAVAQLLSVLEDAKQYKRRAHIVLVDLKKAFDSVEPWSLLQAYHRAGFNAELTRCVSLTDGRGTASVITPTGLSSPRPVERGVRQGETLSPLKFILWLNMWLETVSTFPGYTLHNGGPSISVIAYADDLALIGESREHVQALLSSLCLFLSAHGVSFNPEKTYYVTSQKGAVQALRATSFVSEKVEDEVHLLQARSDSYVFTYLGISLNMKLDWAACTVPLDRKICGLIALLGRKRLSFGHAAEVVDTVVRGRLSYYLQSAQIPDAIVDSWDLAISKLLRRRAGLPFAATVHPFAVPRPAGFGLPLPSALQAEVLACEGVIRLADSTAVGEACRARWRARQRRLVATGPSSRPPPADSFALYVKERLMRSGLDVAEATDLERRLCAASGGDVPLARLLPEHSAGIYATPFRWLGELTKPSPRAPETMVRFLSEKSVARQCKGRRPSWLPHLAALFGPTRERPRHKKIFAYTRNNTVPACRFRQRGQSPLRPLC